MNWKKIILFVFLLLVGLIIFTFPLGLIFLIPYIVFLFLIVFKGYSHRKLIVLIALVIMYLAIMLIPFPICDSWAFGKNSQSCTCIGIKIHSSQYISDASSSRCVGIPTSYKTLDNVQQLILSDLENPNKKLSLPGNKITIENGQTYQSVFGLKNVNNLPLTFVVETEIIKSDKGPVNNLELSVQTPSQNTLSPQEKATYDLKIRATNGANTYLIKLIIKDQQSSEIYEEKSFFVQVVE